MKKHFLKYTILISLLAISNADIFSAHLVKPNETDTVYLYKSLSGVGVKTYIQSWLFYRGSFSYPSYKLTKQDSLVLENDNGLSKKYIKLYDFENQIVIEGMVGDMGFMVGKILFYKENKISRIEHWGRKKTKNKCGGYTNTEFPSQNGKWYYYKKGVLRKTKVFKVVVTSCEMQTFKKYVLITWYSKKGKKIFEKKNISIYSYEGALAQCS